MTLCIAATCYDGERPCIVVSSDWKAEIGEIAASEDQNKFYWMYNDDLWPVLVSGAASDALALLGTYREVFKPRGITKANIYDRLAAPAIAHKKKRIEGFVSAMTGGLTYEYFRRNPKEIPPSLRSDIWSGIKNMKLGCDFIVSTFVEDDPMLFLVDGDSCRVHREENFISIGTGASIATSVLCYRRQNEEMDKTTTLYNVYEATRYAVKSKTPGVGKIHVFPALYPHKKGKGRIVSKALRDRGKKALKNYYGAIGPKPITKISLPVHSFARY